jgi:hypothetical protein
MKKQWDTVYQNTPTENLSWHEAVPPPLEDEKSTKANEIAGNIRPFCYVIWGEIHAINTRQERAIK